MNKATQRRVKVTADLVARTTWQLQELGVTYALVVEGLDIILSNSTPLHAAAILRQQLELYDLKDTARLTRKAEEEFPPAT